MSRCKFWGIVIAVALAALGAFWFLFSPTRRESVEAIEHTADEVTGKRALDQSQQLQSEIKDISSEQKDRLRRTGLDGGAEGR